VWIELRKKNAAQETPDADVWLHLVFYEYFIFAMALRAIFCLLIAKLTRIFLKEFIPTS
jgi:hypothetical protein